MTSLTALKENYNWRHIFEEYTKGIRLDQLSSVVAYDNGENDGPDWIGLFKLKDGRYMFTTAGCDYTGWGCQEGGASEFFKTEQEALKHISTEHVHRMKLDNVWAEAVKPRKKKKKK